MPMTRTTIYENHKFHFSHIISLPSYVVVLDIVVGITPLPPPPFILDVLQRIKSPLPTQKPSAPYNTSP